MKTPVLAVRGFTVRGASLVSLFAAVAGLLFSACSPTLDWREVRPEGGYLTVLLPCKPERLSRDLVLGEGPPRRIELLACTAGGTTWGITSAVVEGDADRQAALRALRAARLRNLEGRELELAPLRMPGIAPDPDALRLTVVGRHPDGSEIVERAALFAHGGRVFHAAVLGGEPTAMALETFFEGLKAQP